MRASGGKWKDTKIFEHVHKYTGPLFLVSIRTYYKDYCNARRKICIGCCDDHMIQQADKSMNSIGYKLMLVSQAKLYSKMRLSFALSGRNQIVNQPLSLV